MTYEKWCELTKELLDCIELAEKLNNTELKNSLEEKLNKVLELSGDEIQIE